MFVYQVVDQAHKMGIFSCAWKEIEHADTEDKEEEIVEEGRGVAFELFKTVMDQNKA